MSWLLNELSPIDVNSRAEVYKFISNETPTDTNKTSNLLASVCRNGGNGVCLWKWIYVCAYVHQEAVGGKARDDTE